MTKRCKHARLVQGPDMPRRYGSFLSENCLDCGKWRTRSHTAYEHMSKWISEEEFQTRLERASQDDD